MIPASTVSKLALIAFLKILMWASILVSFMYLGYWNFRYGSLLVSSDQTIINGYHGDMNIVGSNACHP